MDRINLSKSFTSSKIGVIALSALISGPKNMVELCVLWGLERQKQSQEGNSSGFSVFVIVDCDRISTNNYDFLGP